MIRFYIITVALSMILSGFCDEKIRCYKARAVGYCLCSLLPKNSVFFNNSDLISNTGVIAPKTYNVYLIIIYKYYETLYFLLQNRLLPAIEYCEE